MTDLLKIYQDLFADNGKWRYYNKLNIDPFLSIENSKEFVSKFIELSGKADDNPLFDNIIKLDDKRIKHIVSTYFLGIYLYHNSDKIKCLADKIVNRYQSQNLDSRIKFSFIWYLICLFHDLGYGIENNQTFKSFDEFIEGKVMYYLKERVGVPLVFEKTYVNYFNRRLNSCNKDLNKPDHGICGGILLFDILNSNLIKKRLQNSIYFSWNKKLINVYRFACWVILSHNIYFTKKGNSNEQEYLDNNLQDLILSKTDKPKIKLKNHTFLYLFQLVDSIDPIKLVGDYENLKDFEFKCSNDILEIKINNFYLQSKYTEKIKDLNWWLISNLTVTENRIFIPFN